MNDPYSDFDIPPEALIRTDSRKATLSPRDSVCLTPEQPSSPVTSPRAGPWTPLCDAVSPAKSTLDNPSLDYPSEACPSSEISSRIAQHGDFMYDDCTNQKRTGPWDKLHRITAGIAGIPAKLRRNSGDEKEDAHSVAVGLLRLAFAVCASTQADCLRFASAATAIDRAALKRVLELAVLNGLIGPSTEGFLDHIETFLKSTNSKQSQPIRPRTSSGSSESCATASASERKEHFRLKGRSFTNLSEMSINSAPSKDTDFSSSSFLDFNGKQPFRISPKGPPSFFDYVLARGTSSPHTQDAGQSLPIVMEIDMPTETNVGTSREQTQNAHPEDCTSEGGVSYHSMCDVVLVGENGAKREPVRAEVVSLGNRGDGPTQMRIAFKSECLRTQNEWQRHLLLQQRSLVDAMTTKLESKEEELQMRDDVMAEEKELLRSFRKIVTREIDLTHKSLTVEVFVVEKDMELSREIEELCEILEFPCSSFRSLTLAAEGMKKSQNIVHEYQRRHVLRRSTTAKSSLGVQDHQSQPRADSKAKTLRHMETRDILTLIGETGSSDMCVTQHATPASPRYRRSGTSKSDMSLARPWRSEGERSFTRSGTTKSSLSRFTENSHASHHTSSSSGYTVEPMYCRIVFVGFEWLERDLPPEWLEGDSAMYIVLTSKPDKFEEVGRQLLAENKGEMLERLSTRGISEYVLQPLSLDGLRRLANAACCKSFGHEYLLTTVVGRGSYGVVYRAKRLKDGRVFALKEINTKRMTKSAQAELEIETELLKHLRWPTLVEMLDAWYVNTLRYLLMPLLDHGTIENRIRASKEGSKELSLEESIEWYAQILHGLVYLHHSGVIHRDIKPSNMLLAAEGVLQIGDLGNALTVPGPGPHPCKRVFVAGSACTPCYTSPESIRLDVILFASDLWSVGASLYEIITLQTLFPAKVAPPDLKELIEKFDCESSSFFRDQKNTGNSAIATLRSSPHNSSNSTMFMEVFNDIKQLLRHDPLQRPSAAALASRKQVQEPLCNVFSRSLHESEEHFSFLEILIAESLEAERILPPSVECTFPPSEAARLKKKATRNSLITALTKRDLSAVQ